MLFTMWGEYVRYLPTSMWAGTAVLNRVNGGVMHIEQHDQFVHGLAQSGVDKHRTCFPKCAVYS